MSLEQLTNAPKKIIGVKQATKSLKSNKAKVLFIAKDAEQHVVREILQLADDHGVEVVYVQTMKELGKACEIDVGAATAVIENIS